MAKKQEIRTVSFVHIGDELVNTDDLDDDQRRRLATWLKTTYLNALFQVISVHQFISNMYEGYRPYLLLLRHMAPPPSHRVFSRSYRL